MTYKTRKLIFVLIMTLLVASSGLFYYYWVNRDVFSTMRTDKKIGKFAPIDKEEQQDLMIQAQKKNKETLDPNFFRKIDFESLLSINQAATRWLYVPKTNVDAHVLQEKTLGRPYYLWRNIYGKKNQVGSFLVLPVPDNERTANLIIFGHRMYNATYDVVFTALPRNYKTKEAGLQHEYAYVYEPNRVSRYRLFSAGNVMDDHDIYEVPLKRGSVDYQLALESFRRSANYETDFKADANDDILCLSTCDGRVGGKRRFVAMFVKDQVYNQRTNELEYSRYRDRQGW